MSLGTIGIMILTMGYILLGMLVIAWPKLVIKEGLTYPALYPVVAWSLCGLLMVALHRQHSLRQKLLRQRVEAASTLPEQQEREDTGKFTLSMEASALTIPMEMLRQQSSSQMMERIGRHGLPIPADYIEVSADMPIYEQLVREVTSG
jgi:hypothetical protein